MTKSQGQDFSPSNVSDCIRSRAVPSWARLKEWCKNNSINGRLSPTPPWERPLSTCSNTGKPLTLFLRVPGAPLDNNVCEQVLKAGHPSSEEFLFFRTQHGAYIEGSVHEPHSYLYPQPASTPSII